MVAVKHHFQTAKADGPDSTRVRPTAWNEAHDVTVEGDGVVLGRPVGAGPGAIEEVPMSSMFYPGMINAFGGAVAPPGWHICDGGSLTRADNLALFNAIGTTYGAGAVAGSTFAKPDLRGRVPAGADGGTGRLPGWVAGSAGGAASVGGLPVNVSVSGSISGSTSGGMSGNISGSTNIGNGTGATVTLSAPGDPCNVGGTLGVTGSFSGSGSGGTTVGFGIIQPTLGVNYIIKG